MSNEKYLSMVFYLILAIIISFCFDSVFKSIDKNRVLKISGKRINMKFITYGFLFLILLFIASFRKVSILYGGIDAGHYILYFLNGSKIPFSISNILTLSGKEYLFYNFLYYIGKVTKNYSILFMIIYSIIIYSFSKVFLKNCNRNNAFIITPLLILPYLKSFNLIRNALAISIVYLAIEKFKSKKNLMYLLLIIIAFFNHYITLIFLFFVIFNKLFNDKLLKKRIFMFLYYIIVISISLLFVPLLKKILLETGFKAYVDSKFSFIGYFPCLLLAVTALIFSNDLCNDMKNTNSIIYYKLFVFLVSILPFFIIIGGGSRIYYMFDITRYILWGFIYNIIYKKIKDPKSKLGYKMISYLGVLIWVLIVIYKIGSSYAILPYKFNF